ncbi:MAG: DNA gyrase inhibitor YacG [Cycloclasticus sp.]|nr:DNA gyrase inhibitor YacG [Cycloclasticus sp.]
MTFNVKCPTCHHDVIWSASSNFKPFCSERCKLIDLGDWASEKNTIAGEDTYPIADDQLLNH